jgi:hypothetical protein
LTLPTGIQYGDVYTIFNYEFEGGEVADSKYFIVMGCYKGQIAGFVTTSQEKGGRKRKEGCAPASGSYPWNYYTKTSKQPFYDGTWVIMRIEWHEAKSLASKIAGGGAVRAHTFRDNELRAFRNCFEGSPEWAPICGEYMYGGKSGGAAPLA